MPCPFDCFGQLFLVIVTGSGYAGGKNLACFQGEAFQLFIAFVIDEFDFILAKNAVFSAGKIELFLVLGLGSTIGRGCWISPHCLPPYRRRVHLRLHRRVLPLSFLTFFPYVSIFC